MSEKSKNVVKQAQSKAAEDQAAVKASRAEKAPSRKEELAADHPVARSGLDGVTHDTLNPAFAVDTSK